MLYLEVQVSRVFHRDLVVRVLRAVRVCRQCRVHLVVHRVLQVLRVQADPGVPVLRDHLWSLEFQQYQVLPSGLVLRVVQQVLADRALLAVLQVQGFQEYLQIKILFA